MMGEMDNDGRNGNGDTRCLYVSRHQCSYFCTLGCLHNFSTKLGFTSGDWKVIIYGGFGHMASVESNFIHSESSLLICLVKTGHLKYFTTHNSAPIHDGQAAIESLTNTQV